MNSKQIMWRFVAIVFAVPTIVFALAFLGISYLIYVPSWCIASLADKICKKDRWRVDVNAIEFWVLYHFVGMFGQLMIEYIDRRLSDAGEKTLTERYVSYWSN